VKSIKQLFVAVAAACAATAVVAQPGYPDRPIRLVVPFPAGGGTDILARQISQAITTKLGWTIVVDNKPGAGGNLALDTVAKSKPDGYTFVMAQTDNIVMNGLLYSKLTYDPVKDFEPVAAVARGAAVLVVRADSPYKTVGEAVAAAKANPEKLTFASPGTGTSPHIFLSLWESSSGIKLTHVPYKGAAQAIPDLLGGQVDFYMGSIPTLRAQIESGRMRALGVAAKARSPVLKQVPTFDESGLKGLEVASVWGVMAPAGTPQDVIAKWNAAINQAVIQPEVRDKVLESGAEIVSGTPKQLGDIYAEDRARLGPVIRKANIKLD
jgi:tripartite-type tricarboxylate transporter receptor subunit TctC